MERPSLIPGKQRTRHFSPAGLLKFLKPSGDTRTSIIVVAVVLALYGGTIGAIRVFDTQILKVQEEKNAVFEGVRTSEVEKTTIFAARVRALKGIVDAHRSSAPLFMNIEQTMHPSVVLSTIDFDEETGVLALQGAAANFDILGSQFVLWRDGTDFVKDATLESFSRISDGTVVFAIVLTIDTEILK